MTAQPECQSLIASLEELPQLRPFPVVASRVLAVCNSEDADVMEMAEVMQCDPAMSLRLLRIANSAQYGYSGEIATVEHAIVVLGFRAVRNLALSVSALSVFNEGESAQEARQQLWQHSLGCAAVARQLAPHVSRITPDEAFLAGIMHDVGKLVFFDVVPDDYAIVCQTADCQSIIEVEARSFGITHQDIGQRCGDEWELPAEINAAIGFHHTPQSAQDSEELVAVISVADYLAHAWQLDLDGQGEEDSLDEIPETGLKIDAELLEQIRQEAPAEFESLRQVCSN